jgi:hypothetical protein
MGIAPTQNTGIWDHWFWIRTGYTQKNRAISKVIKNLISHPNGAQHILPTAGTFLMRYQQFASHAYCGAAGTSFQDGVAAGEGFLCAPFSCVQICDFSVSLIHGSGETKRTRVMSFWRGHARFGITPRDEALRKATYRYSPPFCVGYAISHISDIPLGKV